MAAHETGEPFGSFVAALALGLALAAAGGVAYVASAPTIPAQDVIKAPIRPRTTASTLSVSTVPDFGSPDGHAFVPPAGRAVDTSHPDQVIGRRTPAGCTSAAVVRAVARGGVITFNCGPRPLTITMTATAKVVNTSHRIVLDGRGLITLSGGGRRQILYMNTCDKRQIFTTSNCWEQEWPQLVVQNMTFADGYSGVHQSATAPYGGGAIYAEGGQLKVVNSRFAGNRCYKVGPDLGGAAIRAIGVFRGRPVYITGDTFRGGRCSNGSALSSIDVSWYVTNSIMISNNATGWGANPARPGTPGGGSGGAVYTDGDNYNVVIAGTVIRGNNAREGGGAIFFVVDNNHGTLTIKDSTLHHNPSLGFFTAGYPGIFYHSSGHPIVVRSTIN